MIYLGIDPGVSGGMAALLPNGSAVTTKTQDSEYATWEWLEVFRLEPRRLCIELVSGWVGGVEGKTKGGEDIKHSGQPGSAMFVFGQSYGFLRGIIVASGLREGVEWAAVRPNTWQRALHIEPKRKDESGADHKRKLKAVAQDLYPEVKVTLATCDALLIATYCMLKETGQLE